MSKSKIEMKSEARSERKSKERVIDFLRSAITDGSAGLTDVPALIKRVIEEDLWRERFVFQSKEIIRFISFQEFVETAPPEGLGTTLKLLRRLCADYPVVLDLLEQTQEPKRRGGDRRSQKLKENKSDNVKFENSLRGNSSAYSLKKLRTNRPDLHRKVLAKELSVNQAMIAAGFRQKTIFIINDVNKTALVIRKHFNRQEIETLIKCLSSI